MSTPRITQEMVSNNWASSADSAYAKLAKTQSELSSGTALNELGDNPYGSTQVVLDDQALADNQQYQTNTSNALGYLQTTDSSLMSVNSAITTIKQLMIEAQSTNQDDPNSMQDISTEIGQVLQSIVTTANTQYGTQGYIFGGTMSNTQPYPTSGPYTYGGDFGQVTTTVAPATTEQINLNGPQVFGTTIASPAAPSDYNLFDLVSLIQSDITSGSSTQFANVNSSDLDALNAIQANLQQMQALTGSRENYLQGVQTQLTSVQQQLTKSKSNVQDVDIAQATIDFQNESNVYEAALQSGSMIMQTSILNFLGSS